MGGEYNTKRNLIIVGLVIYIALTFISLNYYSGLLPMGLFLVGASFILGIVLFIFFRFLLVKKKLSTYFLVLTVAALLAVISDSIINRVKLKSTQERAAILIERIEKYKNEYGQYPSTLNDLVTKSLIDKVPTTAFPNNQFYYELKLTSDNSNGYTLKYYAPLGMEAAYNSDRNQWYYDD